jgi:hypothetical protein
MQLPICKSAAIAAILIDSPSKYVDKKELSHHI